MLKKNYMTGKDKEELDRMNEKIKFLEIWMKAKNDYIHELECQLNNYKDFLKESKDTVASRNHKVQTLWLENQALKKKLS